jgi:hypothetical protein
MEQNTMGMTMVTMHLHHYRNFTSECFSFPHPFDTSHLGEVHTDAFDQGINWVEHYAKHNFDSRYSILLQLRFMMIHDLSLPQSDDLLMVLYMDHSEAPP